MSTFHLTPGVGHLSLPGRADMDRMAGTSFPAWSTKRRQRRHYLCRVVRQSLAVHYLIVRVQKGHDTAVGMWVDSAVEFYRRRLLPGLRIGWSYLNCRPEGGVG